MSTPSDDENAPLGPVSYEELVNLRMGTLSAEEEESLRMQMQRDPERVAAMLANLDALEQLRPPEFIEPTEVPGDVAARWRKAIEDEAGHQAPGNDPPGAGEPDSSA